MCIFFIRLGECDAVKDKFIDALIELLLKIQVIAVRDRHVRNDLIVGILEPIDEGDHDNIERQKRYDGNDDKCNEFFPE